MAESTLIYILHYVFEYKTHTKANQHPVLFVLQALKLSNELTQLTNLDTGQLSWSRGKELVFYLWYYASMDSIVH